MQTMTFTSLQHFVYCSAGFVKTFALVILINVIYRSTLTLGEIHTDNIQFTVVTNAKKDTANLKQFKMKKTLIGLIGFLIALCSYGQELKINVEVDTIKVIQTNNIPTKEICFEIPYGKLFISKATLIQAWDNELALLGDELDKASEKTDWQIENYKTSEFYLGFVKRHETLYFEYESDEIISLNQLIEEPRPESDTLYYLENYLKDIACNILDIGEFEIYINNKKVYKVLKAKVSRSTQSYETISTEYIVNDTINFWISIPIIRADNAVNPENMFVPKPPTD